MKIDINSDIGEGFGRWRLCDDTALMGLISSANVACGYHAGDAVIMTEMIRHAKANGVALGAHVGLPDLLGFGRVPMSIDPQEMKQHALYQIGALDGIARVEGYKVTHAGTHGVFGMMSKDRPEYLQLIFDAFKQFNQDIIVPTEPATPWADYARRIGLRTVGRIYADRAYHEDGSLVSRKLQASVIHDLETIRTRVLQFLDSGTLETWEGGRIALDARCILVHSDTPGSVEIAQTIRATVEAGGGEIVPLTELA